MNVHPSLPDHPKFLLFKEALGRDDALEFLTRLWAHCQTMSRGENWGKVTDRYVELICKWNGKPGELYAALVKTYENRPGWIERKKNGTLVVSNWEQHNGGLIKSWTNGAKGGRPKGSDDSKTQTHGATPRQPRDNPRVTPRQPTENPIGSDLIGSDLIDPDLNKKTSADASGAGENASSEAPTLAAIQASRTQFAATQARMDELKAKPRIDWTDAERAEWKKLRADLSGIQKKQRAGKF